MSKKEEVVKLSELIVLGSTMIQLNPDCWYVPSQQCGCLIGMGIAAGGKEAVEWVASVEPQEEAVEVVEVKNPVEVGT